MHMIKIYVIEDGGLTLEEKSYLEKLCSVQRGRFKNIVHFGKEKVLRGSNNEN